jgi:hypothetical protein
MLRHTLSLLLACSLAAAAHAQCNEDTHTKVLLVGDSWAFFMGVDQTINEVLGRWGHSNYQYYTNLTLAENGAETIDFLQPGKQAEIQARLDADPDIKVVHLSLGGNDVLGDWHVDFTPAQTDSLKSLVEGRLLEIIDFIKAARPGIHILWSGYTYPNFEEVIESASPLQTLHPFYNTWASMGFPSFEQLNVILNEFSATLADHAALDPQLSFVPATGLMQYTFGQNSPLLVAPGGTYPPQGVPLPEGLVDYPSPRNSMRNYGITRDCFHLSAAGYRDLIEEHTRKFYHKYLMDDHYLLSEDGGRTGAVSAAGPAVNDVLMGGAGFQQYHSLLSFNTTAVAGTPLAGASLFLRREALSGSNPLGPYVQVKVKSGHFGPTPTVEAADFYASADATGDACRFGSNGNGQWLRLDLPEALLPYISAGNRVQFLLSSPGFGEGQITFTGVDDPELAPVLNLRFQEITTDATAAGTAPAISLYPNPTWGPLHLETGNQSVLGVEVFDMMGRRVLSLAAPGRQLDLGGLPAGAYLLHVRTSEGHSMHRIMRQ